MSNMTVPVSNCEQIYFVKSIVYGIKSAHSPRQISNKFHFPSIVEATKNFDPEILEFKNFYRVSNFNYLSLSLRAFLFVNKKSMKNNRIESYKTFQRVNSIVNFFKTIFDVSRTRCDSEREREIIKISLVDAHAPWILARRALNKDLGYVKQVTLSSTPHLSDPSPSGMLRSHPPPLYFDLFDVKLAFTPGGPCL